MKKSTAKKPEQSANKMSLVRVSFERYGNTLNECHPRVEQAMPCLSSLDGHAEGHARFVGRQDNKPTEVSVIFTKDELDAIEAIAKGAIKRVNSSINSN